MCPFTVRFRKPCLGTVSRHPDYARFGSSFTPLAVTPSLGGSFDRPLTGSALGPGLPSPGRVSPHASFHRNLRSIGVFTDFPSTTRFRLALGADLPRADCLYAGNLRFSADGDPTRLFVTYLLQDPSRVSLRRSAECSPTSHRSCGESAASVPCLAPLHCLRADARPVSCYALFQGMAASEPTSWLSAHPHLISHSAWFRDLSRRSGLFPSRLRTLSHAVSLPGAGSRHSEFDRIW